MLTDVMKWHCAGYFYYCENLNLAAQNLGLRPEGHGLDTADLKYFIAANMSSLK